MPSRKLLEQCQKLDKTWSHIFTTIFSLDEGTNEAVWYAKVTELIEKQQTSPIWMSESKVFILFMTRLFIHITNSSDSFTNFLRIANLQKFSMKINVV